MIIFLSSIAHAAPGVFVLGVDGMDPEITQRLMDEGKMPAFSALADEGSFQQLQTANPPQSPVAWSNFVTGMDPGGHGIFDFVHRDPLTYMPISSATPPPTEGVGGALHLFGYVLPTSAPEAGNNRAGTPWWDLLHTAGVDVEVYRIPGNFPVPASEAKVLSGMGTVDMRGGYGTYSLLTDKPLARDDVKGDVQLVTVQDYDLDGITDTVTGVLRGPPDVFHLEPGEHPGPGDYLDARITVQIDPVHESAVIKIADQAILLAEGEWSDWVEVSFDALPAGMMPLTGTVRLYAKELRPNFQLYMSPVNISATAPAMPVSSPDDFSEDLAESLGNYYTQGMPEDTNALKDGVFDDLDYIKQVKLVQDDTEAMLDLALSRFEPGDATFMYVSDIDLQCHMLWRHNDPKYPGAPHPARDEGVAAAHSEDIEGFYRSVDGLLSKVRGELPAETLLLVMSDHGFQPFTRKVHLNSWLRDNGYLTLKPQGGDGEEAELSALETLGYLDAGGDEGVVGGIPTGDVDWSETRAYNIGFNALYLNLKGRESEGIVDPADVDALVAEITAKLEGFVDPQNGNKAVLRVARGSEIYHGPRTVEGPDLVVGYNAGYGGSDQSTLGEVTAEIIEDNLSRWSGNHLMAPEVVPGVLLVNRKLAGEGHTLTDLTATVLDVYDVAPSEGMRGSSILD